MSGCRVWHQCWLCIPAVPFCQVLQVFQLLLEVDAEAFDAQGPFMLRGLSICLNQSRKHLQYVT